MQKVQTQKCREQARYWQERSHLVVNLLKANNFGIFRGYARYGCVLSTLTDARIADILILKIDENLSHYPVTLSSTTFWSGPMLGLIHN
eukprot:2586112-Amphidinium_carterae.1